MATESRQQRTGKLIKIAPGYDTRNWTGFEIGLDSQRTSAGYSLRVHPSADKVKEDTNWGGNPIGDLLSVFPVKTNKKS